MATLGGFFSFGDDTFVSTEDIFDSIDGSFGTDRVAYVQAPVGVTVSLELQGSAQLTYIGAGGLVRFDTLFSIEGLVGSLYPDTLTGDGNNNILDGFNGNDTLIGRGGDDTLLGDPGNDFLSGEGGTDTLRGGEGDDVLIGGAGNDLLDGGEGTDRVTFFGLGVGVVVNLATRFAVGDGIDTLVSIEDATGSNFADTLIGNSGTNFLEGLDGNDTIVTDDGTDTVLAGSGDDTIVVGLGTKDLQGGSGVDTLVLAGRGSRVSVNLSVVDQTLGSAAGLRLSGIENLRGTTGDDTLGGDGAANTLEGGDGADFLEGRGGNDVLDGGLGTDQASYFDSIAGVVVSLAIVGFAQNTQGAGFDTLVGFESLAGSRLNDTLTGDGNANSLLGREGDDTLNGGGGNDRLIGESGNDTLNGEGGDDTLQGFQGDDRLDGGEGFDTADFGYRGTAPVLLQGNLAFADGIDTLVSIERVLGGAGDDDMSAAAAGIELFGQDGNDSLRGNIGADRLEGGAGNDRLILSAGFDTVLGGEGADTAVFDATFFALALATIDLQKTGVQQIEIGLLTISGVENVEGAGNGDVFRGDFRGNVLTGLGGDDLLEGRGGNDTLLGGANDDTLRGGFDDDLLQGDLGNDTASFLDMSGAVSVDLAITVAQNTAAAGFDTITGCENLEGGSGNDTLRGDGGNNLLAGSGGNDTLAGFAGADTLLGGAGNDLLRAGTGDDRIDGGADSDTATYFEQTVAVTVDLAVTTAQATGAGSDTFLSVENLTGGSGGDSLLGNGGNNRLDGSGGIDLLQGRDGNDTLLGGAGNDFLRGGLGDDTITGGTETDTVSYVDVTVAVTVDLALGVAQATGAGSDTITQCENLSGGSAGDTLLGNAGVNAMNGNGGNDRVEGRLGNDTLTGAGGLDRFVYRAVADATNAGTLEAILDFAAGDLIDLELIDTDAVAAGDQDFSFVTAASFTLGSRGQLRYTGGVVLGEVTGDGVADFAIRIANNAVLNAASFDL